MKMSAKKKITRILALLMVLVTVWNMDSVSSFVRAEGTGVPESSEPDTQAEAKPVLLEDGDNEVDGANQGTTLVPLMVNGCSADLSGGFDSVQAVVDYGTELTCSLTDSDATAFLYLAEDEKDEDKEAASQNWQGINNETILLPGNYYLGYEWAEGFEALDYKAGFRVIPVNLETPTDLAWEKTTATWTGITNSANKRALDADISFGYQVTLYKEGVSIFTSDPIARNTTSYDFADQIAANGYGEYTFSVIAVIAQGKGDDRYHDSQPSEASASYRAFDDEKPDITSFGIGSGDGEKNELVADVTDNTGVSAYAFSTDSEAPEKGSDAWKSVASSEEKECHLTSGSLAASGTYYLYVKDEEGNVSKSETGITVTRVLCFADMTDSGLDTENTTEILYLFEEGDNSVTLQPASVTGYVFEGWYGASDLSGSKLTALTTGEPESAQTKIPAGTDYAVYARLKEQEYHITITSPAESKEYDGKAGAGTGVTLTAALEKVDYDKIVYTWYYQSQEAESQWKSIHTTTVTDQNSASAFTDSYTIYQVAESGNYKVETEVTLKGKTYQASAEKKAVILPKSLRLRLKDQKITYGDPVPAAYQWEVVSGLAEGDSFEKMLKDGELTTGSAETAYDPDSDNNSDAGTYTISQKVSPAAKNYAVMVENAELTVEPKNVTTTGVKITYQVAKADETEGSGYDYPDSYTTGYTGEEIRPEIAAWDGSTIIPEKNYVITYSDNVNASQKAKVSITFQGNYTGVLEKNFTITRQSYSSALQMKDGDQIYAENASWTYGEAAYTPQVTKNCSGGAVTYYYAPKEEEHQELDPATASTTMPEAAGTYFAWAVIAGNENYEEVVTPAFPFTIKPRVITLTAVSYADGDADEEHNAWVYDGLAHSANAYKQDGDFVGTDAFKSVTVSGIITDCGTTDNTITYELTPSTRAENYNIKTISGTLQVKQCPLPVPSGLAWSNNEPGKISFTPVSRKNLTVVYKISLYRAGTVELVYETTTEDPSVDLSDVIKKNVKDKGLCSYYVHVATVPKEEEGTAYGNYAQSEEEKSTTIGVVQMNLKKDANTIASVQNNGEDTAVLYLLPGEKVNLKAACQKGYHNITWAPAVLSPEIGQVSDYITISGEKDTEKEIGAFANLQTACEMNLVLTAEDEAPVIMVFQAQNASDAGSVTFTMKAYDGIGVEGYALTASENGAIDPATLTYKPMTKEEDDSYTATESVKAAGTYYLAVKDTSGNVTVTPADQGVTVYSVAFKNGATESDKDLFGGEEMPTLYKVENTTIVFPTVSYTKEGYAFKGWKGERGQIYNDRASYAANASDNLTADWSNEKFTYRVEYYYMNLEEKEDGSVATAYADEPNTTKTYTGAYGTEIASWTPSLQLNTTGYSLDSSRAQSITLGKDQNLTIPVYYSLNQYQISYTYENPKTKQEVTASDSFYFGQTYKVKDNPAIEGYTFSGWNFGDFDTNSKTMPAKNLTVTGSFTAEDVIYRIVYHLQNLPETTGSIAEDNYAETPSSVYTMDSGRTEEEHARQDQSVTVTKESAPQIEGYTIGAVSVTNGAPGGTETPSGDTSSVTGTADISNMLYVNYYYTRNIYQTTLNVYRDKRDIAENLLYTKLWSFSYGKSFTSEEQTALETFGYEEEDADNQWIKSFKDEDGTIKPEYRSYKLADYTDWSTGEKMSTMPAGNVSITKEYVENTSASYTVEFYLQTMDSNDQLVYPENPNHTVYYYDTIGKTVKIDGQDHTQEETEDKTVYLNYNTLGNMLDGNFSAYTYDKDAQNRLTEMTIRSNDDLTEEDVNANKLRVYFKRNEVETKIEYRYKANENSDYQNLVTYTFKQPWGTNYTFDPAAYYYGDGVAPTAESTYTYGTDGQGTITSVTADTTALTTNYNTGNYAISYSARQYIAGKVYSWNPSRQINTAKELAENRSETYLVGQVGSSTSGYSNYIRVNYTKIDQTKTYEMNLVYSGNPMTETTGGDLTVETQNGEEITKVSDDTTYQIRVINEKDLYENPSYTGETTDGHENYQVESLINIKEDSSEEGTSERTLRTLIVK